MTVAISQPPAWCGIRAYSVAQAWRSRTRYWQPINVPPAGNCERRRTLDDTRYEGNLMRTGMQILVAAAVLGASTTAALAQGPYDDPSYWAKVERGQESAWGRPVMTYAPAL